MLSHNNVTASRLSWNYYTTNTIVWSVVCFSFFRMAAVHFRTNQRWWRRIFGRKLVKVMLQSLPVGIKASGTTTVGKFHCCDRQQSWKNPLLARVELCLWCHCGHHQRLCRTREAVCAWRHLWPLCLSSGRGTPRRRSCGSAKESHDCIGNQTLCWTAPLILHHDWIQQR